MEMSLQAYQDHAYKRRPSTRAKSPFRYPGGKGFLTDLLRQKAMEMPGPSRAYAEPFCGGAGAAINLLLDGDVDKIFLNDLDPCVYSAWVALVTETERFIDRIRLTDITVEEWHKQKAVAASHTSGYSFEAGFATFFLNRTSRAGIVIGSGPIGGYGQTGTWKIDARFYRETMIKRITAVGLRQDNISISNMPAVKFIENLELTAEVKNTFIFIDPPYFEIGSRLYLDGMIDGGHLSLSKLLSNGLTASWLMTYDDHPEIRRLYKDFNMTELEVLYSLQRQRKVNEIVIQAAGA
jgi:DNA adenine methylase